ncbi:Fc receptor-like protein 3 isoform X2 [Microcaecilia unicolor]|uniref:Fc receptor-like protein 3 isoform X2 n=1 Tax=Microcaecilia unicolor TaxID=1415580 RepID=A0A6P7WJ80_9AMPH|nr:Fc receptor-like protein 3 isoform X2 [Microcaecilia unicolor]
MLAWASLLYLFAVTGQVVASESKAVMFLDPQWSTILEGHSVTLGCNATSAKAWYTWYKESKKLTKEKGKNLYYLRSAKRSDSGAYSCETSESDRSDPVNLSVSNDWVILQAPYSAVFEGEALTLRCLGWKDYSNVRFYKDGRLIDQNNQTFSIPHVEVIGNSGKYTCWMYTTLIYGDRESAAVQISVKELFSRPVLEIKPSARPVEGSSFSLLCKTELAAQRRYTKLLFTFHKDRQVLVEKSDSPEYNITEAQLENSGEYYCQVETENLKLRKSSDPLQIHVQQLFMLPRLEIKPSTSPVEGSSIFLTCKTELMVQKPGPNLRFSFYKDLRTSLIKTDSPEYIIRTAQLEDSGAYHCQVEAVTASVMKKSPQSHIHVERIPVSGISLEVQPSGRLVNEGENLLMTCSVATGTGLVTISLCTLDSYSCVDRSELFLQRETFSVNVSEKDNGNSFYCMASNDKQTTPIKSGPLQISVRLRVSQPVLRFDMDNHRAVVGDSVVMVCESLRGSPPIRFQFYHGQRLLGSLEVNQTGPGNLSITVASEADAGTYSCDAKNDISSSIQRSKAVNLSVLVPVSGITLSFSKESPEIWTGDNLTFTCAVVTGTSPTFHWLHNGKEANGSSEHYSINAEGNILHIGSVQPLHGGTYQCSATNQLNAEKTFNVSSNSLTVTVLEATHILPTMAVIFSLLCVIILIAVLLFLFFKHQQKSDERYFSPPVNGCRCMPAGGRGVVLFSDQPQRNKDRSEAKRR